MNTNTTTIAGAFEQETWGVEYIRPSNSSLRAAGGVLVSSSNDGAGNGSWSHSPTELWQFPDGSRLEVAFSDCGECRKWRVADLGVTINKALIINGVECTQPQREPLNPGEQYFIANTTNDAMYSGPFHWNDAPDEIKWLERGLVYLNKENAIKVATALLMPLEHA